MPKSRQWSYSKAYPGAGSYSQKAVEKTINNQTKRHYFDMRIQKGGVRVPLAMQTQLTEHIQLE